MRSRDFVVVIGVAAAGSIFLPVSYEYFLNTLQVEAAWLGVLLAFGAVGGICGGLVVGAVNDRLGLAGSINAGGVITASGLALLFGTLYLPPATHYAGIAAFEAFTAFGGVLLVASMMGALQTRTPEAQIGRTMTAAQLALEITGLTGIGTGMVVAAALSSHVIVMVALVCVATTTAFSVMVRRPGPRQGRVSAGQR
jgi:hypothetical protein